MSDEEERETKGRKPRSGGSGARGYQVADSANYREQKQLERQIKVGLTVHKLCRISHSYTHSNQ